MTVRSWKLCNQIPREQLNKYLQYHNICNINIHFSSPLGACPSCHRASGYAPWTGRQFNTKRQTVLPLTLKPAASLDSPVNRTRVSEEEATQTREEGPSCWFLTQDLNAVRPTTAPSIQAQQHDITLAAHSFTSELNEWNTEVENLWWHTWFKQHGVTAVSVIQNHQPFESWIQHLPQFVTDVFSEMWPIVWQG